MKRLRYRIQRNFSTEWAVYNIVEDDLVACCDTRTEARRWIKDQPDRYLRAGERVSEFWRTAP